MSVNDYVELYKGVFTKMSNCFKAKLYYIFYTLQ